MKTFIKFKNWRFLTVVGIGLIALILNMTYFYISSKKIDAQVFLYSETESLMDKLASAVDQNTIDYANYSGETDQATLVNAAGDLRTVFTLQSGAIAKTQTIGTDDDGNGSVDTWTMDPTGSSITPARLKVLDFWVYISPSEPSMLRQPMVTIVLTATLSDYDTAEISIQRTVSTNIFPKLYAK